MHPTDALYLTDHGGRRHETTGSTLGGRASAFAIGRGRLGAPAAYVDPWNPDPRTLTLTIADENAPTAVFYFPAEAYEARDRLECWALDRFHARDRLGRYPFEVVA